GEILRDDEQLGRGHARGDRLAHLHAPLDDHARDRRADLGVGQVLSRALQVEVRGRVRRLGDLVVVERGVVLAVGHDLLLVEHGDALVLALRLLELGPAALDGDLRGPHLLEQQPRVDPGDELALLYAVVEVDVDLRDLAGDLRPHLHGLGRLEGAGAGDDGLDVAARDLDEPVPRRRLAAGSEHHPGEEQDGRGAGNAPQDLLLHRRSPDGRIRWLDTVSSAACGWHEAYLRETAELQGFPPRRGAVAAVESAGVCRFCRWGGERRAWFRRRYVGRQAWVVLCGGRRSAGCQPSPAHG